MRRAPPGQLHHRYLVQGFDGQQFKQRFFNAFLCLDDPHIPFVHVLPPNAEIVYLQKYKRK